MSVKVLSGRGLCVCEGPQWEGLVCLSDLWADVYLSHLH